MKLNPPKHSTNVGRKEWRKITILTMAIALFSVFQAYSSSWKMNNEMKQELQQVIKGTVVNDEGVPLPGVTIQIKDTQTGTITNFDGEFSLEAEPTAILVFSYIGYKTKEIPIQGRSNIKVILEKNIGNLEEIVVIGYGTVEKEDLTGAVSVVDSEEFSMGLQPSAAQALQGRAAGVQITQTSGRPGAGVSIRIRGATSLTAGNEPLFVIDGLPGAPFNALNPGDIASIQILKDASATAIYGARGANGVVIITTKKGIAGEMRINYEGSYGIQEVANPLDLLNTSEYITFINDLRAAQGNEPEFTQEEINAIGEGTDWQEEIFRVAPVQNHQLSFSGGSDKTQYYVSLNYLNQKGIVINTGLKRYGARVNVSHSIDRFKFGINLSTSQVKDVTVPSGGINAGAGVIAAAIQMPPTIPVRNEDGTYFITRNLDLNNPVAQANSIFNTLETNRTFGNIFAEYEIFNNLRAKINLGSNRSTGRRDVFLTAVTKRGQSTNGRASIGSNESSSNLFEFTLNYENTFNEVHQVNVLTGYTYQVFEDRGFSARAQNFPTDAFRTNNLGAGDPEDFGVGSGRSKHQLLSYLGRINYSYLDRYLITGSFRVDGSSRFGVDQKYGYFPSVALGWKLSDEAFLSNADDLSNLKLRLSYGITGNQAIGNYNSLVLLGTTTDAVFNGTRFIGIAPIQLTNPDLKWETTEQFNVGLDYGFFDQRITGSVNYYVKNTSDLLLRLPVPSTSGFSSSLQNVGGTRNSGFEFVLNSKNIIGKFNWTTNLNFSTLQNEVTNLGELPFILQGGVRFLGNLTILKEGEPINSYFGYKTLGIFQSTAEVEASAQPNASPGDIIFKDVNQDGKINPEDRTILGNPLPNFYFGISNNFRYKGFELGVFITGSYGQELLNATRIDSENPISFLRNRQAYVLNRWTPENPTNENPSFVNSRVSRAINTRVIEDASYLRLQNINLSYNFPGLDWGGIESLSIYATAQNLFTITDYSGYNPDVNSFGDSNIRIDYNEYPLSEIYTIGINIGI